jgi:hypothetical protein
MKPFAHKAVYATIQCPNYSLALAP